MSVPNIDIRDVRPEDAEAVYAVHALTANGQPAWPASVAECREHTEWMLSLGNPPQVAVLDGLVVGEMQVWWGDDVAEFGRSLDVSTIYVHPDWQRRGIGTALIERAAEMATGHGCTCMTVCYDESAEGFYRGLGFEDGIDTMCFRLDIADGEPQTDASWKPVELAGLTPPRGSHLRTERMQHPSQQWALVCLEESEPPAWGDDGAPTPNTSAFRVRIADREEPLLAVFRRATWAEQPWRAMPYVWAGEWDRPALEAVIACAREADIRALDIWVYGEMVGVLRCMGADPRGHDNILVLRLEQRTTPVRRSLGEGGKNEQRRS